MTLFRDSFATQQLLPPWKCDDVSVIGFLFDLDRDTIQSYCDRFFNIGSDRERRYKFSALPDAQIGVLICQDAPAKCSLDRSNSSRYGLDIQEWDHTPEKSMFAGVPVLRQRITTGNLLVEPEVWWFQPFIVTDNSSCAFGDREVVGLEALWGQVAITQDVEGGRYVDVKVPSWLRFAPNSAEQIIPFARLETGPPIAKAAAAQDFVANESETNRYVGEMNRVVPNLPAASGGLSPADVKLVTLKQFRDSAEPTRAIYQSLVGARSTYSDIQNLVFYNTDNVSLQFQVSDMVHEILHSFLKFEAHVDGPEQRPQLGEYIKVIDRVKVAFSFTATQNFGELETLCEFIDE